MEEEKSNSSPSSSPQVQANQNISQSTPTPPAKEKMPKKAKRAMWAGIIIISFVLVFVLLFVITPQVIAHVQNCSLNSIGYQNSCHPLAFILSTAGNIGSTYIGIPLVLIGASLILYAILYWKKVKNPGLISFLIALLIISIYLLTQLIQFFHFYNTIQKALAML